VIARRGPAARKALFYNPAMALDRDIGVAVLSRAHALGWPLENGWEMLAATGVRGLRLQVEARAPRNLYLSEANRAAIGVLRQNAAHQARPGVCVVYHDARWPLPVGPLDYIDIDPFGSPLPYLPAALAVAQVGSLVALTATDLPVFAGVSRGASERKYGARPIPGYRAGEGGLRILLAALARAAANVGMGIVPKIAYVGTHHLRAYVVMTGTPALSQVGLIDVQEWKGAPLPGSGAYGPLWLGPIMDSGFVKGILEPRGVERPKELQRFLACVAEESSVDVPFFDEPNRIAERLGLKQPPALAPLLGELRTAGFRAARSHVRPAAFRTDAPRTLVEELARRLSDDRQSQNARVRA
jgi:tRNA (guanine26-N2/guanine27-N2)-dimethyltransferase